MIKFYKLKRKDIKPGEFVYSGNKHNEPVKLQLFTYDSEEFEEKSDFVFDGKFYDDNEEKVFWLNIHGIHNVELIKKIANEVGINNLNLQDIINTNERPKIEESENYIFITAKSLTGNESIDYEQISFVLGKNFIISFQEKIDDTFDHIRLRIRENLGLLRKRKSDYLLFMFLDAIIDNYYTVIDKIVNDINIIEQKVLSTNKDNLLIDIEAIKKELQLIKNKVQPLKDTVHKLNNMDNPLIDNANKAYFTDIKDSSLNLMDYIDYTKNSLDGITNIYLSSLSNKMNDTMKLLAVISTIFIPLTFIAGLYGMNFEYMPELKEPMAYPIILVLMFLISVTMIIYFKFKKFL